MKYLVTGGAGFIGAYVVAKLVKEGAQPVVYDSDPSAEILKRVLGSNNLRGMTYVQGSLTDLPHLMNVVREEKVSVIIHLAALQIPAVAANPPLGIEINCVGTSNVLETACILGVRKVVWASSIAVFGPGHEYGAGEIPNDGCHRPVTLYGACKSFCEKLADHYTQNYELDTIGLRFSGVYGLGRNRGVTSFTTTMIEKAALGEPYTVPFSTDLYGWQFVEDAAELALVAARSGRTKVRVFNTPADVRPVMDGVDYLRRLVPKAQFDLAPGSVGIAWRYDTSALEAELGFRSAYSMEEGILKTLTAFREEAGLSQRG